MKKSMPTDTELLDWAEAQGTKCSLRGDGWVFIPELICGQKTLRKALAVAMRFERRGKK